MSPTTIEDTLNMAREGWTYPNLAYPEAMAMLQSLSFPEIVGKELSECAVAWKEMQFSVSTFNQSSTQGESSLKFASEAELFKQHQASKYIREHAPKMDRSLKETSPASLEKHLQTCIMYGIEHGLHYKLWYIFYDSCPNLKQYTTTVRRAAAQYPKYRQILEKMASFWVLSLKPYASQNVDYESKKTEYKDKILSHIQKGEINEAIVYLKSEAQILKTYNPCYAAESKKGGQTEDLQTRGTEREIRSVLLSLLSAPNAPLDHIWEEMVQNHLRENPSGFERGPTSVQNLELEDLITRFKNACDMDGFIKKKGSKTSSLGVYNSKVTPPKDESQSKSQTIRCDKCRYLDLQCSPNLKHCTEKNHQKGQNFKDPSPKTFNLKPKYPYCLADLKRNIAKAQLEQQMKDTLTAPPQEKSKCDKCQFIKRSCQPRFNHCKKLGHQANQPQEDKTPSAWNYNDSCPFCAKEKQSKPIPIRSILDNPLPPIPTLPTIPNRPFVRYPSSPHTRTPVPNPPFPHPYAPPFTPNNKKF